jgi:hypothetical protein
MNQNLLNAFNDELKRIENSDIQHIYKILFNLLGDEDLSNLLETAFDDYKNGIKEWYAIFHKSIRVCDIFSDIQGYKLVDTLTDEQKSRHIELMQQHEIDYQIFKKENPSEDFKLYQEFSNTPERKKRSTELKKLNELRRVKVKVPTYGSLGGSFDAILWCLISLDEKNHLHKAMERTFKICS